MISAPRRRGRLEVKRPMFGDDVYQKLPRKPVYKVQAGSDDTRFTPRPPFPHTRKYVGKNCSVILQQRQCQPKDPPVFKRMRWFRAMDLRKAFLCRSRLFQRRNEGKFRW